MQACRAFVTQCHSSWRVALRLSCCTVAGVVLSGCGTTYLLQAARGQWQVQHGRQPLAAVIARPDTDGALRARLEQVSAARDFASRELGLPDNRSYRTWRALGRPYVVWNVVAAPEFSLQPRRWCFPFTGCLTYRGYFHEQAAQRYARTLQRRGYDVTVGGVSAYSTLGHFADPVLDTMMRYGDVELIGILFHELAHQQVYARSDSEFNESFATTVEREGLRRWLTARGRSAELDAFLARQQTHQQLQRLLLRSREQLRALYAQPLPAAQMRERKRALLRSAGDGLLAFEAQNGLRSGYDAWIHAGLNNAHLVSVGTYHDCVPAFEQLLALHAGSLTELYAEALRLARGAPAARQDFCAPAVSSPRR
jgi:predicted aminopeptidase